MFLGIVVSICCMRSFFLFSSFYSCGLFTYLCTIGKTFLITIINCCCVASRTKGCAALLNSVNYGIVDYLSIFYHFSFQVCDGLNKFCQTNIILSKY